MDQRGIHQHRLRRHAHPHQQGGLQRGAGVEAQRSLVAQHFLAGEVGDAGEQVALLGQSCGLGSVVGGTEGTRGVGDAHGFDLRAIAAQQRHVVIGQPLAAVVDEAAAQGRTTFWPARHADRQGFRTGGQQAAGFRAGLAAGVKRGAGREVGAVLARHAQGFDLIGLAGGHLRRVDLGNGAGCGLLRQAAEFCRAEGAGRERAAQLVGVGGQHAEEELADSRRVGEQPVAQVGIQHLVGLVHGRQGGRPRRGLGDDAMVRLVQRRHVHAQARGQQREGAGHVFAQAGGGGADAVAHQHRVGEERIAAVHGRGVRGVAQVVQGQQQV
ncbi:hypothetical protein D9M72_316770 [compost metagenome]